MTSHELIALLEEAHRLLEGTGPSYEAQQLQKRIDAARLQLARRYPAVEILRELLSYANQGRHMSMVDDPDVMAAWVRAQRALELPMLPVHPREDLELVFDETVADPGLAAVQVRGTHLPKEGAVVQVWQPRGGR